jgi:predicted nucleotidyltransferase
MTMTAPILDLPLEEIAALCREYDVAELSLFGSALRDEFRDDSDVDMLVLFEPDATVGILELAALQRKLGMLIHRNVDLVPKKGLKSVIRNEILGSARVIFAQN